MSVFFYGRDRLRSGTGVCFANALVRIPRPKIEELALQTQDVGICRRHTQLSTPTLCRCFFYGRFFLYITLSLEMFIPICYNININSKGKHKMNPLCKKVYIDKIVEIIVLIIGAVLDVFFISAPENHWLWWIVITLFTLLLLCFLIDLVYWIFQPNVLIYQYETGIIINRNKKIEYTEIKNVYFKNYIHKKRRGNYYKDTYSGIIFIQLKSGKVYKISNAFYPLEAVDIISRIKQQRKFR